MSFKKESFVRSILLFIIVTIVLTATAKNNSPKSEDSIALARWMKPIQDSIFYNPEVVLPWLDSVSYYADSTQSAYANYIVNNIKGNYNWAIRQFDSASSYYKYANQWAVKGGLLAEQIKSFGNLGLVNSSLDNFDTSSYYYLKAISLAKENGYNKLYVRNILNLTYIYNQKGEYADVIELLEEARVKSELINDEELNALLYGAFGSVYYFLGDLNKMKYYYQRAINYYKKIGNNSVMTVLYMNIAESFSSITQNYDSAAYYFNKAREISVPQNQDNVAQLIDLTRGNLYYENAVYDSAFYFYERALYNPLTKKYARREAALLINMGNVYRAKHEFANAVEYYHIGYRIADSLKLSEYKSNALLGLVKIDSIRGNFEDAFFRNLEWQKIQNELKKEEARSQLMSNEVERALEVQNLKNELLQAENEYQEDQIENQRWIGGLIIFVLLGVVLFSLVQYINHKKIKQLNRLLKVNVRRLDDQNTALDQLNKTKDKFFSIISHDLRSPFAAIRNAAVLLDTAWDDFTDDERNEVIRQLDRSTENTHHLLEELLQWSQLQQGLIKLEVKTFSVTVLVHELKDLFSANLDDKEIQLKLSIDKDIQLTTDHQMLKQLLHNLLSNAIKFSLRGGLIEMRVRSVEKGVHISVRDYGIGIPMENQERIFELENDFGRPGTATVYPHLFRFSFLP